MAEMLQKLSNIVKKIKNEKKGILRMFLLIKRIDFEIDKWDIVISADWITDGEAVVDTEFILRLLKEEFGADLAFLSKIVFLKPDEPFIQGLAYAFKKNNVAEGQTVEGLRLSKNFTVRCVQVIYLDLKNFKIAIQEQNELEATTAEEQAKEFDS